MYVLHGSKSYVPDGGLILLMLASGVATQCAVAWYIICISVGKFPQCVRDARGLLIIELPGYT